MACTARSKRVLNKFIGNYSFVLTTNCDKYIYVYGTG